MALFTDANTGGVDPLLPANVDIQYPTHVVSLTLSSGQVVNIGTVLVCLKLLRRMVNLGIYWLMPNEDVICLRVGYAKLLFMEASFQNQKLLNAGSPCYEGGAVKFNMRCSAQTMTLDEALASVGHYRTRPVEYESDWDMQQETGDHNPRIRAVDYKFRIDASNATQGTQLEDGTPFIFG